MTTTTHENEIDDILSSETKRIYNKLQFEYQQMLQNEFAVIRAKYTKELEEQTVVMKSMQQQLAMLESRLEASWNYESGSKKAHRIIEAALSLADKLNVEECARGDIAARKGAAGNQGVIASAVKMIPKSAQAKAPTVTDLKAIFDKTYAVGRQVRSLLFPITCTFWTEVIHDFRHNEKNESNYWHKNQEANGSRGSPRILDILSQLSATP